MTLKPTLYCGLCLLYASLIFLPGCKADKEQTCKDFTVNILKVNVNTLVAQAYGPGPYAYAWSNGVGDLSEINASTFGNYSVTVTNPYGCSATASFDYQLAGVCTSSALIVSITSTTDALLNVTLTAAASQGYAPYVYAWSTGEHTAAISAPTPGIYSVTTADSAGCTATKSFSVACKTGCIGCDGVNSVTDIDGNTYAIIKLGGQCWMAENLRTAHYRDGSAILEANDSALWYHHNYGFTTPPDTGTWCYYMQDPNNNATFGKLYNWVAATDSRGICPQGWRIPTDAEWAAMVDSVADRATAGTLLKSVDLWPSTDTSTNQSGFNALPARERYQDAKFNIYSVWANFWSSDPDGFDQFRAYTWMLNTDVANVYAGTQHKGKGHSCRCIKE